MTDHCLESTQSLLYLKILLEFGSNPFGILIPIGIFFISVRNSKYHIGKLVIYSNNKGCYKLFRQWPIKGIFEFLANSAKGGAKMTHWHGHYYPAQCCYKTYCLIR